MEITQVNVMKMVVRSLAQMLWLTTCDVGSGDFAILTSRVGRSIEESGTSPSPAHVTGW
jgi:hypothetical protein